jgi:hypothetical protein
MEKFTHIFIPVLILVFSGSGSLNLRSEMLRKEIGTTLPLSVPTFQLASPNPSTLILMQGQAGMATLAIASGESFRGEIELHCAGTTPGLQCLVSPQTVKLAPRQTSEATIAVATQGASAYNLRSSAGGAGIGRLVVGTLTSAGLCCLLCLRRRRFSGVLFTLAMSLAGSLVILGCSTRGLEKQLGTPIGKVTLRITASSGTETQSQDLLITVQQP